MVVTQYHVQMTKRLERAILERLKLKKGERLWRVHVLVAEVKRKLGERK